MEEDWVAGLKHSLGMSARAVFSAEDVTLLFNKVFRVSCEVSEGQAAMEKVAGDDKCSSCDDQNILDVLLEMEVQREKREMLFWDKHFLNNREPNPMKACFHDEEHTLHLTRETDFIQRPQFDAIKTKKWNNGATSMKKLKKTAGKCWAKLASEGVHSIFPFPCKDQTSVLRSQTWGCISLSDVLLLVEVKYDVVMHLLYAEMQQEHHTPVVWKTFSSQQQCEEVNMLMDLAEAALASVDLLGLAVLPGAFRIYNRASLGSSSESGGLSWSAVSFLNDLHTFCQQEKIQLTALGDRLCRDSLKLLCLYIRLATYRAQREKTAYGAFLAARQSWETWPQVFSPGRAEQAAVWLHSDEDEQEEKLDCHLLRQKSELQLLVLTHEQERKHLLKLVSAISLQDLAESTHIKASGCCDNDTKQSSLRTHCIKKMREIKAQLLAEIKSENPEQFTNQHTQAHEERSQPAMEKCALLLLSQLMELQEVQTLCLLQALLDQNPQNVLDLREKYEANIRAKRFSNLLGLLTSCDSPTSNVSDAEEDKNGVSAADPVKAAAESTKQDICSGCGAVMEDLPYLEISRVTERIPSEARSVERDVSEGADSCAETSSESLQKQGSLIALAWSKAPEDRSPHELGAADGESGQKQDALSRVESTHSKEEDQFGEEETLNPHPLVSCSSEGQVDRDTDEANQLSGSEPWEHETSNLSHHEHARLSQDTTREHAFSETNSEKNRASVERIGDEASALERERTMKSLVDMQRRFEQRQQRDKERQRLKVQERLSIMQTRKAGEDLLGLGHMDTLRHLTHDLPLEDKTQQKTVVRERLEQVRRERSYVMQSKRNRNTAGFNKLLGPVGFNCNTDGDGET